MKFPRLQFIFSMLFIAIISSPASGAERVIINPDQDGDLKLKVNDGGTIKDAIKLTGSTGAVTIGASGETATHVINGGMTISDTAGGKNVPHACTYRNASTVDTSSPFVGSVTCNAGERTMGGGCDFTAGDNSNSHRLMEAAPSGDTAWTCRYHTDGTTITIRAWANCCVY